MSCQKQNSDENRRCNQTFGFCRYLMRLLKLVARKTEMHEVMLTVQHQNADALRMYRRYIRMFFPPLSLFRFRMLITGSCLVRGLLFHYLLPALMVRQTELLLCSLLLQGCRCT